MKIRKSGTNFVAMAAIAALIVGVAVVPAVGSVKGANPNIVCGPGPNCGGTGTTTSKSPPPTTTTTAASTPSIATIDGEYNVYVNDMEQELADLQSEVPVIKQQGTLGLQAMSILASEVALLKRSNWTAQEISLDPQVTEDESQVSGYTETESAYLSLVEYQFQLQQTYYTDIVNLVNTYRATIYIYYGAASWTAWAESELGYSATSYNNAILYFESPGSGGGLICLGVTLAGVVTTGGASEFIAWAITAAGLACST